MAGDDFKKTAVFKHTYNEGQTIFSGDTQTARVDAGTTCVIVNQYSNVHVETHLVDVMVVDDALRITIIDGLCHPDDPSGAHYLEWPK